MIGPEASTPTEVPKREGEKDHGGVQRTRVTFKNVLILQAVALYPCSMISRFAKDNWTLLASGQAEL